MLFNVDFTDVEYFDDGREFRHSGSFTVNGIEVDVPLGADGDDMLDAVAGEIGRQLGRELTDEEAETLSDDTFSLDTIDAEFN
jgi:hypothetical protein